jgi:hypothetical protein
MEGSIALCIAQIDEVMECLNIFETLISKNEASYFYFWKALIISWKAQALLLIAAW